jgi:MFS family permease
MPRIKKVDTRWAVLGLISLCVLASLGFGRFSFGAVLPFMKEGLSLDYRETGFIASAMFIGYLISAFVSGYFVIRFTAKKVIILSLIIIIAGMIALAGAETLVMAAIGSFVMGVGSGGAYVPALGLIPLWFPANQKGMAMGFAQSGSGTGMALSGMMVPAIVSMDLLSGWRFSWYVLSILVLIIAIVNMIFLKGRPVESETDTMGDSIVGSQSYLEESKEPDISAKSHTVYKNKLLWFIGFIYLAWGFSYLIFSTFLVDYLITDVGLNKHLAGQYFAAAGLVSICSGFLWGAVSDRIGRILTLFIIYMAQAGLTLLMGMTDSGIILLTAVVIYGLTLWAVPSIVNTSISDYIVPRLVPVAMGFITLFFGLGQYLSPVLTGFLIEATQAYYSAFLLSSSVAFIGGMGCLLLYLRVERRKVKIDIREEIKASRIS